MKFDEDLADLIEANVLVKFGDNYTFTESFITTLAKNVEKEKNLEDVIVLSLLDKFKQLSKTKLWNYRCIVRALMKDNAEERFTKDVKRYL